MPCFGSGYDAIASTSCPSPLPLCDGYDVYAPTIRLYRAEHEHGYWVFTRMTITDRKRRPPNNARTRTLEVIYLSGAFDWNVAL